MTTTVPLALPAGTEAQVKGESPWRKAGRRFLKHRLAIVSLVVLGLMVLMALFAPLIERYSPIELRLEAMAGKFVLSEDLKEAA